MNPVLVEQTLQHRQREAHSQARTARLARAVRAEHRATRAHRTARLAADRAAAGSVVLAR